MDRKQLEAEILTRGREFFATLGNEIPSIFRKDWWTGKVMDWSMSHEDFKVQLFRFIDVLPYLTTEEMLKHHIQEYFSQDENIPAVLRFGAKNAGIGGRLGTKVLGKIIRTNLENMALQFIIGNTISKTVKNLNRLRRKNFAFTLDILGEATVSEKEADSYAENYIRLLEGLQQAQSDWAALGKANSTLDWSHAPKVNISIKPSALYSQISPADFEGSVEHILGRLKPVYRQVTELNGFMCIDTEMRKYKEIIFAVYRRLRSDSEFRDYPHLGLAMQVYLKSSDRDIDLMLDWARQRHLPISIRLVKGAYWDYEIVIARQNGWPIPVYTSKAETDAAFERSAEKILRNHDFCHLACASHNVRSVCSVIELASTLEVPKDRYEFQVLYGMAEPFRNALLKMTGRVRLYCPHGKLLPGMAYLIRRLMENTSNESFLRQTFVEGRELEELLQAPHLSFSEALSKTPVEQPKTSESQSELGSFKNESLADFSLLEVRDAFVAAITEVRKKLGKTYPLFIGGREITANNKVDSVNPAHPNEIIGQVCQTGKKEIADTINAAQKISQIWG
ncbi:MAG: proline dehydrogenase family protein, partial [Planctomycetota bacterium]